MLTLAGKNPIMQRLSGKAKSSTVRQAGSPDTLMASATRPSLAISTDSRTRGKELVYSSRMANSRNLESMKKALNSLRTSRKSPRTSRSSAKMAHDESLPREKYVI